MVTRKEFVSINSTYIYTIGKLDVITPPHGDMFTYNHVTVTPVNTVTRERYIGASSEINISSTASIIREKHFYFIVQAIYCYGLPAKLLRERYITSNCNIYVVPSSNTAIDRFLTTSTSITVTPTTVLSNIKDIKNEVTIGVSPNSTLVKESYIVSDCNIIVSQLSSLNKEASLITTVDVIVSTDNELVLAKPLFTAISIGVTPTSTLIKISSIPLVSDITVSVIPSSTRLTVERPLISITPIDVAFVTTLNKIVVLWGSTAVSITTDNELILTKAVYGTSSIGVTTLARMNPTIHGVSSDIIINGIGTIFVEKYLFISGSSAVTITTAAALSIELYVEQLTTELVSSEIVGLNVTQLTTELVSSEIVGLNVTQLTTELVSGTTLQDNPLLGRITNTDNGFYVAPAIFYMNPFIYKISNTSVDTLQVTEPTSHILNVTDGPNNKLFLNKGSNNSPYTAGVTEINKVNYDLSHSKSTDLTNTTSLLSYIQSYYDALNNYLYVVQSGSLLRYPVTSEFATPSDFNTPTTVVSWSQTTPWIASVYDSVNGYIYILYDKISTGYELAQIRLSDNTLTTRDSSTLSHIIPYRLRVSAGCLLLYYSSVTTKNSYITTYNLSGSGIGTLIGSKDLGAQSSLYVNANYYGLMAVDFNPLTNYIVYTTHDNPQHIYLLDNITSSSVDIDLSSELGTRCINDIKYSSTLNTWLVTFSVGTDKGGFLILSIDESTDTITTQNSYII